jgi:hypothetical protein
VGACEEFNELSGSLNTMYVCMYVCTYVCMYVCTYIYIYRI